MTDLSSAVFRHMAEMTILVTHLVVEFAKHLPGFVSLSREDQIVLLKVTKYKHCFMEYIFLKANVFCVIAVDCF